jgi:hypothetical protein
MVAKILPVKLNKPQGIPTKIPKEVNRNWG